jgi:lipopolysaccharide transport system permease protein
VTAIRPPRGWQLLNVAELWKFRELIYFLIWRDVKVRYKQTILGVAWAVLQPALMMVVFTLLFSRLAGISSGDLPYPLFAFAGLLPWTFFASALTNGGNSVVGSERLITKIYFPRLAIPFAAVGAGVVDFVVAFGLLIVLMFYYGRAPGLSVLLVPVFFGVILLAGLGVATLLAALNVAYRDFRYVIPFLVQIWMFATPTLYMQTGPTTSETAGSGTQTEATSVEMPSSPPGRPQADREGASRGRGLFHTMLALNPMTGLIGAFRAAALGQTVNWGQFSLSALSATIMFLVGCFYFRRVEDGFVDII